MVFSNQLEIYNESLKEDLVKNLVKKKGFSLRLSKEIVDSIIDELIFTIKNDNLILKNIGSFKILKKKERIGRNPRTQEKYLISSRNSISFTTSKKLIKLLNG